MEFFRAWYLEREFIGNKANFWWVDTALGCKSSGALALGGSGFNSWLFLLRFWLNIYIKLIWKINVNILWLLYRPKIKLFLIIFWYNRNWSALYKNCPITRIKPYFHIPTSRSPSHSPTIKISLTSLYTKTTQTNKKYSSFCASFAFK